MLTTSFGDNILRFLLLFFSRMGKKDRHNYRYRYSEKDTQKTK